MILSTIFGSARKQEHYYLSQKVIFCGFRDVAVCKLVGFGYDCNHAADCNSYTDTLYIVCSVQCILISLTVVPNVAVSSFQ